MAHSFTSQERNPIKELLKEHFGLAFEEHRHSVLDSAVHRRMLVCGIDSAQAYRNRIDHDSIELSRLVEVATNQLSRFFRNRPQIRAVTEYILPELVRGRRGERAVRNRSLSECNSISVLVAGCATGEEPYSLAMVLLDSLPESAKFHITATDISRRALSFARAGIYPIKRVLSVPCPVRARYFVSDNGGMSVSDSLRRNVSFVEHNVLETPIVREVDIVFCRNVLIYLASRSCRIAIRMLRESLADGGFLIIGNSETLPRDCGFNAVVAAGVRIYRRR